MTEGTTPFGSGAPRSVPHAARLRFAQDPIIFRATSSDACAQSCACAPIHCSVVPSTRLIWIN